MKKMIKKAQMGTKSSPKKKAVVDSVPSEMFPGKMIPRSQSNYENGNFGRMLEQGKTKPAPKKVAPKKKMKDGGSLGMKSVKAGFDKNPGVTRADVIVAAKGKAKYGKKMVKKSK
jgi:hypothetical protein